LHASRRVSGTIGAAWFETPRGAGLLTMRFGRQRMKPKMTAALMASTLLLVAPLLAGCLERGPPTVANTLSEDDDTFCRANNVAVGSSEYIACRKDRDVQRNNANARTDRRQRDLGEYMLNHPEHP
jgi:hypothetical protein